tara:strand:- start:315 stop:1121 length:807 start_codon:yes stop_codon:yes gene_type:complete
MTTQKMGEEGFRWWLGIVEDLQDPKLLGRAKVRIINEHDEAVETGDIDWAHVMMPSTSACVDGVGDSPNLAIGSRVVGFYMDGNEKQMPMIIGSFPTIPGNNNDRHSLSWLHRGQNTITKQPIGPEPPTAYAAQYPYNRTITTKGGHVIELDDTPENTRVHIYHKSGSYIEINNEGRVVIKSVVDGFDITDGTKTFFTSKDFDVKAEGSITLGSKNSVKIAAPGGITVTQGSIHTKGTLGSTVGASGAFTTVTGQTVHVQNGLVVLID